MGELDFAIINLTSDHPLLEYHLLYEDYMVAVVAADHPVCRKMGSASTDDDPVLIDLKEFNGATFYSPETGAVFQTLYRSGKLPMITQNPEAFFLFGKSGVFCPVSSRGLWNFL